MQKLKHHWKRVPKAIRKPLVFMVGSSIVIAGIAMLLLPGPGWASIFLGFAILATEFATAEKVRAWLVSRLKISFTHGLRAWKRLVRKVKA